MLDDESLCVQPELSEPVGCDELRDGHSASGCFARTAFTTSAVSSSINS